MFNGRGDFTLFIQCSKLKIFKLCISVKLLILITSAWASPQFNVASFSSSKSIVYLVDLAHKQFQQNSK